MGLAMLPSFIVRRGDGLAEVPSALPAFEREPWLVVHPDGRLSARVRRTADLIARVVREPAVELGRRHAME